MKSVIKLSFLLLFFASCAKIPAESVVLVNALENEGERMHKINIMLTNKIFSLKRNTIEKFIKEEYEPFIIKAFIAKVPDTTDFKADFAELMEAITPKINARRDTLLSVLEIQRENMIEKLNTDYKVFDNAMDELKKLLESAVKIDKEKLALYDKAKSLSNNNIDFNKVENALDKFINSAGHVGNNAAILTNDINQIFNQ